MIHYETETKKNRHNFVPVSRPRLAPAKITRGGQWCPYICARITARFIPHNSTQAYQLKKTQDAKTSKDTGRKNKIRLRLSFVERNRKQNGTPEDHMIVNTFVIFLTRKDEQNSNPTKLTKPETNRFLFWYSLQTYVNNLEINSPYHWKISLSSIRMAFSLYLDPLSGQWCNSHGLFL